MNHYGYSLGRNSTLLCQNYTTEEEKDCFTSKTNEWKFKWDNRDFVVDPEVVVQFIRTSVLPVKRECNNLLKKSPTGFTMYNLWCKEGSDAAAKTTLMHYFRDEVSNDILNNDKKTKQSSGVQWDFYCASTKEDLKAACSSGSGVKCTPASARQVCNLDQGCLQIQCKSFQV